MSTRPLFISLGCVLAALPLHAEPLQTAAEIEDIGEITAVETETIPAEGKSVEAPPESRVKFRFNASTRAQYTSNAILSGNHGSGDVLFFPTLEGGMHSELRNGFSFDLAARIESGLYTRYDDRSFVGYGATGTFDWRPRPNAPRLYLSAEPYRYDNFDIGGLLTQAVGFTIGTDHGIPFNQGNSAAFLGYNFTHYLSDPSIDSRNSHKAVVGLVHTVRPQMYAQLFYSFNYDQYTGFDRRDFRHIVGANLTWQLNRRLFATLSGSFVDNDSDQEHASYQSAGAALQLTLQY
ncbi:MAG: hypothetical protein EOP84_31160 [Verrucomicrobiaceae bacterium]|nr:MAG: hypothetical protein EOP84_31160 [Verrucomicrobiaceae bacterium]